MPMQFGDQFGDFVQVASNTAAGQSGRGAVIVTGHARRRDAPEPEPGWLVSAPLRGQDR